MDISIFILITWTDLKAKGEPKRKSYLDNIEEYGRIIKRNNLDSQVNVNYSNDWNSNKNRLRRIM